MSLAKASLWTATSTLVKIGAGLLVVKLLAVSFGPAGVGQAGNFRQMVTVLGVLAVNVNRHEGRNQNMKNT